MIKSLSTRRTGGVCENRQHGKHKRLSRPLRPGERQGYYSAWCGWSWPGVSRRKKKVANIRNSLPSLFSDNVSVYPEGSINPQANPQNKALGWDLVDGATLQKLNCFLRASNGNPTRLFVRVYKNRTPKEHVNKKDPRTLQWEPEHLRDSRRSPRQAHVGGVRGI